MYWWIITVACICSALLIQYLCSSKLLNMKQAISLKTMALRDVRDQGARLNQQEMELKAQQGSLTHTLERLRRDVLKLRNELLDKGVDIPQPTFSLEDPGDKDKDKDEALKDPT